MLHKIEPAGPLILPPGSPPTPRGGILSDVAELAAIEQTRWAELENAITGPTAYVAQKLARAMLEGVPAKAKVVLYSGDPGPEGTENASPIGESGFFQWWSVEERRRHNETAVEWAEVAVKERLTHFGIFILETEPFEALQFGGSEKLSPEVEIEIGDTIRFNIGSLIVEVPAE